MVCACARAQKEKKRFPNISTSHVVSTRAFYFGGEEARTFFPNRSECRGWRAEFARPRAIKAGEKCAIGEREKGETLQPDTNKGS